MKFVVFCVVFGSFLLSHSQLPACCVFWSFIIRAFCFANFFSVVKFQS